MPGAHLCACPEVLPAMHVCPWAEGFPGLHICRMVATMLPQRIQTWPQDWTWARMHAAFMSGCPCRVLARLQLPQIISLSRATVWVRLQRRSRCELAWIKPHFHSSQILLHDWARTLCLAFPPILAGMQSTRQSSCMPDVCPERTIMESPNMDMWDSTHMCMLITFCRAA